MLQIVCVHFQGLIISTYSLEPSNLGPHRSFSSKPHGYLLRKDSNKIIIIVVIVNNTLFTLPMCKAQCKTLYSTLYTILSCIIIYIIYIFYISIPLLQATQLVSCRIILHLPCPGPEILALALYTTMFEQLLFSYSSNVVWIQPGSVHLQWQKTHSLPT